MTIYRLTEQLAFPNPELAEPEGLLAVGGDLSPHRLLLAYSLGVFPWFNDGEPPLWCCPDPRCVLFPAELKVSRSLSKLLRRNTFHVTSNRSFAQVIDNCAALREANGGTWITDEMRAAYCRLHELGYAHSVEVWLDGALVGGLYGVCLGRCFFGESMFFRVANASKVAFVTLVRRLREQGYALVDCQLPSDHLTSFGARSLPRREFLQRLVGGGVTPGRPVAGPFPVNL
ncbi:MAG: leucyl/phenylalanyl-tRNA--protein transferase [Desulfuromonadaceae bacterium]|nr:leucyl/phenylalanyl-tRNA--protein transferase [Desulfuromonadaceae bacterium]